MLTTELAGRGGVQYAGRLFLRALHESLRPAPELTVVSLKDQPASLDQLAPECRAIAGGGSRLYTGLAAVRAWCSEAWDLVFVSHINLASLVVFANRARRVPVVGVVYSQEAWQPISRLRRRGMLQMARLLYISQHTRVRSEEANPWLAELSVEVCYLGLLPKERPEPPTNTPVTREPEGAFALVVGRMAQSERYKGHEELIRAWPEVERQRPGLRLVLVGDGDDHSRLEKLAQETGAAIQFLGAVDDDTRDALLRRCRCFCLPARGEGFGLVYLEAMRAGKPVLAGSGDAGAEVVVDGQTGRTVDPTRPKELLQGILDVSGPQGEAWGQAGKERFEAHFTYEKFLERFSHQVRAVR
jgi:phosphatidylinositol alpha-1,6-mannosyltransferase